MRILVTGSNGMLGTALCKELSLQHEVIGIDVIQRNTQYSPRTTQIECDITDKNMTIDTIVKSKPEVVIHTAAYTDVDGCELNPEKAHRINGEGTQNIAIGCRKCNAVLFYISTDFVFDGNKADSYSETDEPNPINVYGVSKLEGENYVRSALDKFFIIRTSWLFGSGGKNFVDTIIRKAREGEKLKVVNDQYGSPTYTYDLAKAISRIISLLDYGIYHISNSGVCSWFEYAKQILEYIDARDVSLEPLTSEELGRPAKRPKFSALDNSRYEQLTNQTMRPWQEALKEYLDNRNQ